VAAPRPRLVRRAVHGVLLLDKALGVSSNAALQQAKRLYRAEKAGHTGTLDPLATGLLPLCFGAATKFAQISLDAYKRYLATLKLGQTTSTGDAEGEVLSERPVAVSRAELEACCAGFVGAIRQLPPMHSALKHEGKPLYDYARAGIEIERAPRSVTIHSIAVTAGEGDRWTIESPAPRAPTFAPWQRTSGTRSAAARIWRRCAAPAAAVWRSPPRARSNLWRRCRRPSSTPRWCRPTRSSPTGRRSFSMPRTRAAFSPACVAGCRWPTRRTSACTARTLPFSAAPMSPAAN
jgi:tRNA pseudouridine(55) synthase